MNKILLQHINIFNPEDSSIKYDQNILIENDLIKSIAIATTENIESIDCTDKFAIAGMFECHAHLAPLTITKAKFQKELLREFIKDKKKYSWDDFVALQLEGFIKKGITQIRDVGGPIDNLASLNNRIINNKLIGPEIFYSGPMLESSPLTWKNSNSFLPGFTVAIDTVDDLKILDNLKSKGASLIKTFGRFDKDIYKKLLIKAKSLNLPVTHDPGAPLFNSIPMDCAINAGITCIEHGKAPLPCTLIPELQSKHDKLMTGTKKLKKESIALFFQIAKLREKAICDIKLTSLINKTLADDFYFCPTLYAWKNILKEFNTKNPIKKIIHGIMKRKINSMKSIEFLNNFFTKKLIKAGTKILVGQDGFSPDNTYNEMRLLYDAGLSIEEIIKGATIYPARWLKIDDLYGTIAPSKKANICILNSNPLLSLKNINDVYMVLKNGNIVFKN